MRKYVLFLLLLVFCNCKTKDLKGRFYQIQNDEKKISLNFISDSTCLVKQVFFCERLAEEYKNTEIMCSYKKGKMKIVGTDRNLKKKHLDIRILLFKDVKCLKIDCQGLPNYTYLKDYEILCNSKNPIYQKGKREVLKGELLLNLINDTLQIKKDTIFFGYNKIPRVK